MRKRVAKMLGLIAVWIGLSQSSAVACECTDIGTPNELLQAADVVFAGKAIGENQIGRWTSRIGFDRRPPFIHFTEGLIRSRMTFEVATVWKGDIPAKTSVVHGGYCGIHFVQGGEYIVYAKWFKGELATGTCGRKYELRDAGEDLAAFGSGKPPAPNPSSQAAYIGRLFVVLMLVSTLGWAVWQARRKYGVQRS